MNFVESVVVDVLHAVVDDGASEDVPDVSEGIENLDQITRTGGFGVLSDFLFQEFDSKLNQLL